MSLTPVETVLRGILIPFVNKSFIGTVQDISKFTSHDRVAIKKYLDFYVDLMILVKYKIGERDYFTINRKYLNLYTDSNILKELASSPDKKNDVENV